MNKTLKLLALLVFAGAALNACGGCPVEEETKKAEDKTEEVAKTIDTEVVEAEEVTE